MARYNPFRGATKTARASQTKEFQDIDEETGDPFEEPFTLTFFRRGDIEDTKAYELGQELVERYVGDPVNDIAAVIKFPPVRGKSYQPTATTCQNAAAMYWSQPQDVEDKFSPEEFIAMRLTWATQTRSDVMAFLQECQKKKKKLKEDPEVPSDMKEPCESA